MNRLSLFVFLLVIFVSCAPPQFNSEAIERSINNGKLANEGFVRSLKFVEGWMTNTDSASGLIPTT